MAFGAKPQVMKFNELLEQARNIAIWIQPISENAYRFAQESEHIGHKRKLLELAENTVEFVNIVNRMKDF